MKFTQTHTDFRTGKPLETVSIEIAEHSDIGTVLDAFARFLRASGYEFEGTIDIIDNQEREDLDDLFDISDYDQYQSQFDPNQEDAELDPSDWPFPKSTKP